MRMTEGRLLEGVHRGAAGDYPYLTYLPAAHHPAQGRPLLVLLHGCRTTAAQQMHASAFNPIADREGFVVLYPDVTPDHPQQCWRAVFGSEADRRRGAGGDADALAAMIRTVIDTQIIDTQAIDPARVYLMGMSSGGFQAVATATVYPELFAAVGVVAAGSYGMDWSCTRLDDLRDRATLDALHEQTLAALGTPPRVLPLLAIGGGQDALRLGSQSAPGGATRLGFAQWRRLVEHVHGQPTQVEHSTGVHPRGQRWRREVHRLAHSTLTGEYWGEYWDLPDLGHDWPGGSDDPALAQFTDPTAPSGAQIAWGFFKSFRHG